MITDSNLLSLAAPATRLLSAIAAVQTSLDAKEQATQTLRDSLGVAQAQAASLAAQLAAVTLDDESAQAAVLSLMQQLQSAQAHAVALAAQLAAATPVVFDDLELTPWLIAGGTAANTGAAGNSADSTQTQSGAQCATFGIIPAGAYADKYWYKKFGPQPTLTRFEQKVSFLFPTAADAAASQCVETDLQQCIGGVVYNFGTQHDFAENSFRLWNRSAVAWIPVVIPMPRKLAGTWAQLTLQCHRDATRVYYDAVLINGVPLVFAPVSFPAPTLGLSDMLNYGFQLDSNAMGKAYTVAVNKMKLSGWVA